jgi:death on curing protein
VNLEPDFLELDDVLFIHDQQIQQYGGSTGIRDQGLLESAIAQPQAGFGGEYVHKNIFEMAAGSRFTRRTVRVQENLSNGEN